MKNSKGFTLIEILIVIVILGILASLALPKISQSINKAYAGEALQQIGKILRDVDMCTQLDTAANCNSFAKIGDGSTPKTKNFSTYTWDGANIIATCDSPSPCKEANSTLTMPVTPTDNDGAVGGE